MAVAPTNVLVVRHVVNLTSCANIRHMVTLVHSTQWLEHMSIHVEFQLPRLLRVSNYILKMYANSPNATLTTYLLTVLHGATWSSRSARLLAPTALKHRCLTADDRPGEGLFIKLCFGELWQRRHGAERTSLE